MITLDNLNLAVNEAEKAVTLPNGAIVHVKQYIGIGEVNNLIIDTLEFARTQDGLFNDVLLEAAFFTYIVKYYTDIDISNSSIGFVYDAFHSNNIADMILAALAPETYDKLYDFLTEVKFAEESKVKTMALKLNSFISDLPSQLEGIGKMLENFNPEDYAQVMNFINAAGGDSATQAATEEPAE